MKGQNANLNYYDIEYGLVHAFMSKQLSREEINEKALSLFGL